MNHPKMTPELNLLLLTCAMELTARKKAQLMQALTQQPINWDRLYRLATRHRVTPFLYRTLQDIPGVPAAFLATLQANCRANTTDYLLKRHEYYQLSALLDEHTIPHKVLKGIYLAEHAYPDSSLRICGDIDVLIQETDVEKTIRLLQANHYRLNQKQAAYFRYGKQFMLTELFEVSLFKPFFNNSQFDIDLHWRVLCFNKDYNLFDLPYAASQPTFSTERELVLLVTHHGVNNIWQHIYFINDLYFVLNDKPIDWEWLMDEMRRYGLERVFLAGLYWCQQIWALPLPPSVAETLTASELPTLAVSYATSWERTEPIVASNLITGQLAFFSAAQTQVSNRLKIYFTFLSSRIFRASVFRLGGRIILVPKELGFLTIFIRAIGSLYRFFPGKPATGQPPPS
ncbi:nucleotidyltransferase domain-containing protein [Spirosoma areae]